MFIAGNAPTDVGNHSGRPRDDRADAIIRWEPERTSARTLANTLWIIATCALIAAGVAIALASLV